MSRLKVALQFLPLLAEILYLCEAQGESQSIPCLESMNVSCEEGTGRGSSNFTKTILIPSMEFTCNGTIAGWTVSGMAGQGTEPPKLQIWRRNITTDGDSEDYYHKQGPAIPIDPDADGVECEEILTCNNTFQCRLNETYQIAVQSETDIVGIELPPLLNQSFELFFTSDSNISQYAYVWYQEDMMMVTNASLRVGSQDVIEEDKVLLYLNVSTVVDISPCAVNTSICDHICTDVMDSLECSCYEGYTLASDGWSCLDTDECAAGTHNCQQRCVNILMGGGFMCDCEPGYLLNPDNNTCSYINRCATNNGGCAQQCSNINGCSCRDGYELDTDGKSCNDVDECTLGTHNCSQLCINAVGGFRCECHSGYQLNSDRANCTDIDECASNSSGCQDICSNTDGSFECSCRKGYTLGSNGRLCNDIDECANDDTHECQHVCHNTEGSYRCSCHHGYMLTNDGRTCTDRNECSLGAHSCEQLCVNSNGSYSCKCNQSYQIAPDGETCLDVNECESNNGGCQHSCSNTVGSFVCSCRKGYQLSKNGKSCNERTDLTTGAAVGGTLGILVIVTLLVILIILCVYFVHLRRSKQGTDANAATPSKKCQLRHEISLPYVVENKRFSDTLPNTRGPKILVLNATTPDNDRAMNKSLQIYNSLFDSEEVTDVNSYSNRETIPT